MGLNFRYLKDVTGVLRLLSLILLCSALSCGLHGYLNSEYNKSCRSNNGDDETTDWTTFSTGATNAPGTTDSTATIISTTATSASTTDPTTGDKDTDKAPILWMELFHLIVTTTCFLKSTVLLLLHLVKRDLLADNPKFHGVDFGYHMFGSICLLAASIFMIYSAKTINNLSAELCIHSANCQLYTAKIIAGAFSFLAAIVYVGICITAIAAKRIRFYPQP